MKDNSINNEEKKSLFYKIFSCCINKEVDTFEIINKEESHSENSILDKAKDELEREFSVFPIGTIRNEERTKIDFTKEGLIKFILNLPDLDYEKIYNENNFIISKRDSSEITDKFPLVRCEVIKNKSYFQKIPNIKLLIDVMTDPKLRREWDDNVIEYKIVEKLDDNSEIIKIITKKLLSIISEKEFHDKRIGIFKDGKYFLFSSSIPESNNLISVDHDKGINYLSVMIVKEDNENFYFDCFNQIDFSTELPENFIETNLPNKTISFFKNYFEYLNAL